MPEKFTLTTPAPGPTEIDFEITGIYLGVESPAIKVDIRYNTGKTDVFRYVPSPDVTLAQVKTALTFINDGKFKTVQNKSLYKWLLEQVALQLNEQGTVTGVPE